MERKTKRALRAFFLAMALISLIPIAHAQYLSARQNMRQKEIRGLVGAGQTMHAPEAFAPAGASSLLPDAFVPKEADAAESAETEPVMLRKYAALYEENSDLAGWLSIEGTKIDGPVMQCGDDEYYLHHDFYREDSKYGCLYVKEQADLADGTNFIIYGHNMKDGSMFGGLDRYAREDFWREHPVFSFDTLFEERGYVVIAAFYSQVFRVDEDVFKYYQFYKADTQEEFDDFYRSIKELSLYDTGVEAAFGDTFLTLSTCAYHVEDGRFVVVAKRVRA